MINSIGLPNKGLDGYLAEDLPLLAELPVPLIVNVMGSSPEEVATLVAAFAERDEVAALELNVSCPNVKTGLLMGADPGETAALMDAVRPRTAKPLIVKLTPNCASPAAVAAAAEQHGADAVSLDQHAARDGDGPAPAGRAVARRRHRRRLGPGGARDRAGAGARGARARARCRSSAWAACRPGRHARDLLDAGADLVAVGTESFRDPLAGARIAAELRQMDANSGIIGAPMEPARPRIAHNG